VKLLLLSVRGLPFQVSITLHFQNPITPHKTHKHEKRQATVFFHEVKDRQKVAGKNLPFERQETTGVFWKREGSQERGRKEAGKRPACL
jgi:hypothetical protein